MRERCECSQHLIIDLVVFDYLSNKPGRTWLAAILGGLPDNFRLNEPRLEVDIAVGERRDEFAFSDQKDVSARVFMLSAAIVTAQWPIASADRILREIAPSAYTTSMPAAMDLDAGECVRSLDCQIGFNARSAF